MDIRPKQGFEIVIEKVVGKDIGSVHILRQPGENRRMKKGGFGRKSRSRNSERGGGKEQSGIRAGSS